ncbi:MAG: hypothetical protein N2Z72_06275 [Bacteroidales bacterium]|nr:hypothetical protein [Bacteroidales bacterium]
MRRILIFFNIIVVLLFVTIWILLFTFKNNFYGSGLDQVRGKLKEYQYFSESFPYFFYYPSNIVGFLTSEKDTALVCGLWYFNVRKKELKHHFLETQERISKIFSILPISDTGFYLIGKTIDSMSYVLFKIEPHNIWKKRFYLSSPLVSISFHQNKIWLFVRGSKGYVVEGLYLEKDSLQSKKYRLPNFFNRISYPVGVLSDGKRFEFLFYTTHYPYKGVWIWYDTTRFSYFMLYDEKLTYPLYSVHIRKPLHQILKKINKLRFGLVPDNFEKEWWDVEFDSLFLKKIPYVAGFYRTIFKHKNLLVNVLEEESKKNWILHACETDKPRYNFLFFKKKKGSFVLHDIKKDRDVAFLNDEKPALLLPMSEDTLLFLTSKFNMAYVSPKKGLLGYRSFFKLVNYRILINNPKNMFLFEAVLPTWDTLAMFFILYGLPILILISLFVFYLVDLLRKPSFFYEEKIPLHFRLLPATLLYCVVFFIKAFDFIHLFSLF